MFPVKEASGVPSFARLKKGTPHASFMMPSSPLPAGFQIVESVMAGERGTFSDTGFAGRETTTCRFPAHTADTGLVVAFPTVRARFPCPAGQPQRSARRLLVHPAGFSTVVSFLAAGFSARRPNACRRHPHLIILGSRLRPCPSARRLHGSSWSSSEGVRQEKGFDLIHA